MGDFHCSTSLSTFDIVSLLHFSHPRVCVSYCGSNLYFPDNSQHCICINVFIGYIYSDINFVWFMLFQCFPPLCGIEMSFHFLNVLLKNKKYNLDIRFTNIPLCGLTFVSYLNHYCPIQRHGDFLQCILLEVL